MPDSVRYPTRNANRTPNRRAVNPSTPHARLLAPLAPLADIKVAHSVFALPFALLASFAAAPRTEPNAPILWRRFAGQLALIILCMVLARTWAMLINRLADRAFDAANPRTAGRILASGRATPAHAAALAAACAIAFTLTASLFYFAFENPLPPILALPVLAWIALYSFTKRFTFLCHLFLGGALAASPIAAAVAIDPSIFLHIAEPGPARAILLLALFVMLWVAGFDISYALQDLDFDRAAGLHSIPARFGVAGALAIARALHTLAFLSLLLATRADPRFGPLTLAAALVVGALLIYEHIILAHRGIAGLPLAFFTLNGVISLLLGLAGAIDLAFL